MPKDEQHTDLDAKILDLVREAVAFDEELREKYHVENKFRFVRERLQTLLDHLESNLASSQVISKDKLAYVVAEDEIMVYVHLYNVQGATLSNWQTMLTPKVFYEYSVNRPIYLDKTHVEALFKNKPNKMQHAYLIIAVKKNAIITLPESASKDANENPILRVKEGSLHIEKLIAFVHNGESYLLSENGSLVKK